MPALKVRFVVVVVFQAVPEADRVTVLLPSVMVLTLELEDIAPAVTLKFLVSNVPFVTVSVFEPIFSASTSSTMPPIELIVMLGSIVLPAEVIV